MGQKTITPYKITKPILSMVDFIMYLKIEYAGREVNDDLEKEFKKEIREFANGLYTNGLIAADFINDVIKFFNTFLDVEGA